MLKKISWVIAALFVASAMIFIGCPTELGKQDDGSAPKQAEDLVLTGDDIVLKACGSNSSDVTIAGNKATLKGNNTGFYFEFPAAAAEYAEVQVFFKVDAIIDGKPGLLIKRNTSFANPIGITSNEDPAYQLNHADTSGKEGFPIKPGFNFTVGKEFDTGKWKTNQFENMMAFQNQIYNPEGNTNAHWTVEVVKILFPGGEPVVPVLPPEYKGDATKVVYTKNATTGVETVVDSDPSITGSGVTINATGVATFNGASNISYKFPTSATGFTGDPKLETDWDYVEIEFTIANGSGDGGEQVDLQILQYGTTTGYAQKTSNDVTGDVGNYLNAIESGKLTIQTWGSGGKGGFTIKLNDWNLPTGGGKGNAYEKFDMQIKKVTFTKGTRYKVDFYSPQANFNTSVVVLSGNGIGTLPSVRVAGYTLFGWYDKWDTVGLVKNDKTPVSGASDIGNRVTGSTAITANTKLYAYWFNEVLEPIVIEVGDGSTLGGSDPNGTLFTTIVPAVTPYEYDDKEWWVFSGGNANAGNYTWADDTKVENIPLATFTAIKEHQGVATYARLGFEFPTEALLYDTITITFEAVDIGGSSADNIRGSTIKNSKDAASGASDVSTTAGNVWPNWGTGAVGANAGGTQVYKMTGFTNGGFAFVKNNPGVVLIRITKIEFTFD